MALIISTVMAPAIFGEVEKSTQDPFLKTYLENVSRMSKPDTDFKSIAMSTDFLQPTYVYARSSTTCSQRCSTTCSKSCTTTRGCSSNCKVQTAGCQAPAQTPPSDRQSASSSSGSPTAVDFTPPSTLQTTFNVQRALVAAGFHICADGQMSDITRRALVDYQSEHNLSTTGAVDEPTWSSLRSLLEKLELAKR
jgi:peptidoglycan hydrolase-like protein with peptidoglycan-binding domain